MQVYSINKNEKTTFNGLTKSLKNRIYVDGQKDIEKILLQKNKTNPVVGQLPAYIFNKISPEKRKTAILEILKTFDNVTNILRDYVPDMTEAFIFDEDKRNCPDYVNKMLTECFQKHNIISKFDDIELRWLGKGGRGKAYKIVGLYDRDSEDEYVLKVFHQIKGKEWHPFKSHGCYAELNSAAYWRNVEGFDTHRGKFFFGSLDSGYMVTKFLDEDTRLPKRIVDEYKYGIKCTDEKKYKTKASYEQDYNYVKDYNFDYGGMRVVNRLKNGDKVARKRLEKLKGLSSLQQKIFWFNIFFNNGDSRFLSLKKKKSSESDFAGITLGIKYLYDKNYYIDRCLKLEKPKVDQAIAYVLKYLDNYEDQLKYFEILAKRKDEITQTILFNEIPLLAKRKDKNIVIQDDINASLQEIFPERIYDFYMIAEKHAMPETVEHLASFVHLLPENKVKQQYRKITNIYNEALQERLIWKLSFLSDDVQKYAVCRLSEKIILPELQERLLRFVKSKSDKNIYEYVQKQIEEKNKNNKL